MSVDSKISTWEDAVIWLRDQPNQRQLVLDAFYDDPLIAAAQRYFASGEWQAVSQLLQGRTGRALDVGAGRGHCKLCACARRIYRDCART